MIIAFTMYFVWDAKPDFPTNPTLSLFPMMSSNLVVAVANRTLWWKIDHGEQPLVHLGCAYCFVVAGFVAKFWEYFVEVLGFIFWVIWWVYRDIFGDSSRILFMVFSMGFFLWLFYRFFMNIFGWKFKCFSMER